MTTSDKSFHYLSTDPPPATTAPCSSDNVPSPRRRLKTPCSSTCGRHSRDAISHHTREDTINPASHFNPSSHSNHRIHTHWTLGTMDLIDQPITQLGKQTRTSNDRRTIRRGLHGREIGHLRSASTNNCPASTRSPPDSLADTVLSDPRFDHYEWWKWKTITR